jgi:hypothetical protein
MPLNLVMDGHFSVTMIGILTWPVYRGKKHGIQIGKHLAKGS